MFKKAATELLSVKKDDVQSLLLASVHSKSEDIIQCLSVFPYFSGWSEKSIKECCIMASIKRFLPDTVIIDDTDVHHSYTYFVIDGICTLIQKVVIETKITYNGKKVFKFYSEQNLAQDRECKNVEIIFVKIRNFVSPECFGLGEDLANRWVLSETPVRCLVIPKDFLLQHNQNNIWPRVRHRISASFPSNLQIYKSINQQVQWCRFKKEFSETAQRRKHITNTQTQDVPFYLRINVNVPDALL